MGQWLLFWLAMLMPTAGAARVHAQSWLVVPVAGSPDGLAPAQTIDDHVVSALRTAGESVIDTDDARRDVERDLHREAPTSRADPGAPEPRPRRRARREVDDF